MQQRSSCKSELHERASCWKDPFLSCIVMPCVHGLGPPLGWRWRGWWAAGCQISSCGQKHASSNGRLQRRGGVSVLIFLIGCCPPSRNWSRGEYRTPRGEVRGSICRAASGIWARNRGIFKSMDWQSGAPIEHQSSGSHQRH